MSRRPQIIKASDTMRNGESANMRAQTKPQFTRGERRKIEGMATFSIVDAEIGVPIGPACRGV
jgi:hypothetical protein